MRHHLIDANWHERIMSAFWIISATFFTLGLAVALVYWAIRRRNMHLWLPNYFASSRAPETGPTADEPLEVFIAVCDHYEPEWGRPEFSTAIDRVRRWHRDYPHLFDRFTDSSGRPPQHTFFYPADEYRPEYLDLLSELCDKGLGDVDIHLHHDNDTPENLRDTLESFKRTLADRHGLLRTDPNTGEIVYGFIHGNWALCNSRPDGRWCGVPNEIPILRETGCYADFTLPSAPSDTQTATINNIYYATDRPGRCKSHESGTPARIGVQPPSDSLLMIQGPLGLDWQSRKFGIIPRIENGDLHAANPPTWDRFRNWLRAGVTVAGKPNWRFVKLHTHGAKPGNLEMWLGDAAVNFHADLARQAKADPRFRYHYVTAWEMAQLVHQAEQSFREPDFNVLRAPAPMTV